MTKIVTRSSRRCREHLPSIDIRALVREGAIGPDDLTYQGVRIYRTAMTRNATRQWFKCPRCGDGRAILYRDSEGLGCCRCMNLGYENDRLWPEQRRVREQERLERQLRQAIKRLAEMDSL